MRRPAEDETVSCPPVCLVTFYYKVPSNSMGLGTLKVHCVIVRIFIKEWLKKKAVALEWGRNLSANAVKKWIKLWAG